MMDENDKLSVVALVNKNDKIGLKSYLFDKPISWTVNLINELDENSMSALQHACYKGQYILLFLETN